MFAILHSDINCLKSGLLHLTDSLRLQQQKSKMELETKFLGTISLIETLAQTAVH
jgi:hypothetical protein